VDKSAGILYTPPISTALVEGLDGCVIDMFRITIRETLS